MARRYVLSAYGFLAGVLLAALLAAAMLLATRVEAAPAAGAKAFHGGECASGFVEAGTYDFGDPDSRLSSSEALARGERAALRPEVRRGTVARLTASSPLRQVWTYVDDGGRALAEITLERAASAPGWNLAASAQCASRAAAAVQRG